MADVGATTSGATLAGGVSATTTVKLTLSLPGVYPEQFDNIGAGLSGNALWIAHQTPSTAAFRGCVARPNLAIAIR